MAPKRISYHYHIKYIVTSDRNQAFETWRHFDTKQKYFTLFDFVDCVWSYGLPWPLIFDTYKLKKTASFIFLRMETFFLTYVTMQYIWNKIIEINFCLGRMVWPWFRLLQHWTFVKYWWDSWSFCIDKL